MSNELANPLCVKCGEKVEMAYISYKGFTVVEPCKKCLKKEYDRGLEDGEERSEASWWEDYKHKDSP